jgi:signal-transduction protein with cAMP-binding, CBS, and nucleotidyltransferase domain
MKTGIKVADAMTSSMITIGADESILNCARLMVKEGIGSLVVVDETKLLGIITERDMLNKVVAKDNNIKKTSVSTIMTKKPINIEPDMDLYDAMILMRLENVRRLPVVDKGNVVGLLTHRDILSIQPELYDLVIESFNIREKERKASLNGMMEGKCYACRSYGTLTKVGGKWLCDSCKE